MLIDRLQHSLDRLWASAARRVAVLLLVAAFCGAAFWALLEANRMTGGRFELSPATLAVLVGLANVGSAAVIGAGLAIWDRLAAGKLRGRGDRLLRRRGRAQPRQGEATTT